MELFKRTITQKLLNDFFQGRALILVGARQTGKTTLVRMALEQLGDRYTVKTINGDDPLERDALTDKSLDYLRRVLGDAQILFVDEGQKIRTIGQSVKLLVDYFGSQRQIIVTGSSTLNLLDATQEPLTGRKFVYTLYPLAISENFPRPDFLDLQKNLEERLLYGSYPRVVQQTSFEAKIRELRELVASYLYRDILELQQVKSPDLLHRLLQALALQIGSEVSYTELAQTVGADKNTVERYIQLLERSFVIFRLPPYAANQRRAISKLRKIYFWDTGIRNALIQNFNPLDLRTDSGALFENWMIAERLKRNAYEGKLFTSYFWRTYDGNGIDYLEESGGQVQGYEFKWRPAETRLFQKGGFSVTLITPYQIIPFLYE
ncbi:MAG: ATP-binding protein [Chloroflexi bacterium]|nr:ATP-binding protein [Chloroflexota bacterium]